MANFFALFKNSTPDIPSSLTKIGTPFSGGAFPYRGYLQGYLLENHLLANTLAS